MVALDRPIPSMIFAFVVLSSCKSTDGALTVYQKNGDKQVYQTSTFVSYGPQDAQVLQVPLLWVSSEEVCRASLNPEIVRGRVVLTRMLRIECDLSELYSRLEHSGAAALALQTFSQVPGILSFAKSNWAGLPNGKIPCVDVAGRFYAEMSSGLVVDIDNFHITEFQDIFLSWPWTLVMRIILPLLALYTCVLGFQGASSRRYHGLWERRRSNKPRPVGFIIGIIEMVTCLVIAVNLVLGYNGPMLMPYRMHAATILLLSGSTLFATVLLGLLAREKTRALNYLPERDVWVQYRITLTVAAVMFVGCDLVLVFRVLFGWSRNVDTRIFCMFFSISFLIIGQSTAGAYFIYQVSICFLSMPIYYPFVTNSMCFFQFRLEPCLRPWNATCGTLIRTFVQPKLSK